MFPVDFAVITFVSIDGCAACYVFQQWFEIVTFVGIGRGDVQLLDIAVGIGAGVLLVAEFELAVFLGPSCVLIFAQGGFAADCSAFVYFDGLALFAAGGLTAPMDTLTTKDRLALVTVYINRQPYYIVDITLRMLLPKELYKAQGFPDDYIYDRDHTGKPLTKTAQVRMCGNSISPPPMAALIRANWKPEPAEIACAA